MVGGDVCDLWRGVDVLFVVLFEMEMFDCVG